MPYSCDGLTKRELHFKAKHGFVVFYQDRRVSAEIYDLQCQNRNPECLIEYASSEDALVWVTHNILVSWKLGYEYLAIQQHCKGCTFGGFYNMKSEMWAMNGAGDFLPYQLLFQHFAVGFMAGLKIDFLKPCPICRQNPKLLNMDGTTCDRDTEPGTAGVCMCRKNNSIEVANTLKYVAFRTTAFRAVETQLHLVAGPADAPMNDAEADQSTCSYGHAAAGIASCCAQEGEELVQCEQCSHHLLHRCCQSQAERAFHSRSEPSAYCYQCEYAYQVPYAHTEFLTEFEPILHVKLMEQARKTIAPMLPLIESVGRTLSSLTSMCSTNAAAERKSQHGIDSTVELTEALDSIKDEPYGFPSYALPFLQAANWIHLRICGLAEVGTPLTQHERQTYAALGDFIGGTINDHNGFTSVRCSCIHLWDALVAAIKGTGDSRSVQWGKLEEEGTFPALLALAKELSRSSPDSKTYWLRVPVGNFYAGMQDTAQRYLDEILSLSSTSAQEKEEESLFRDVGDMEDLHESDSSPGIQQNDLGPEASDDEVVCTFGSVGDVAPTPTREGVPDEADRSPTLRRGSVRLRDLQHEKEAKAAHEASAKDGKRKHKRKATPKSAKRSKRRPDGTEKVVRRRGPEQDKRRFREATAERNPLLPKLSKLNPVIDGALYHFDEEGRPRREGATYVEDTKPGPQFQCRKFYQTQTLGTWGIFLMFCEHSHCYGFHDILHAEGRRDAFMVLRNLANKPKVVVYDFACQLEEYCMARDPFYFKDVVFLIDKFHHFNHTCCPMYKMSNYPHLSTVNSVVCEQANSHIKGAMVHQGKKMKGPLFYLTLLVQIARWNFNKDAASEKREAAQTRLAGAEPAVDLRS